jgi:mycothiol system anti-sigma-R factor
MSQPNVNPFVSETGKKVTCMEMLQLILDGEASTEQRDYFKSHMDHCMPCFKSYSVDMAIKELLKTKCCGGDAPVDLINQIKGQIAQNL